MSFEFMGVLDAEGLPLRATATSWSLLEGRLAGSARASLLEMVHPDDRDLVRASLRGSLASGASADLLVRCLLGGEYRTLEWRFARGSNREIYAVAKDASERRCSEEAGALRVLEDEAEQVAALGSWRLDLATAHLDWSPEMYRIFGVDPGAGDLDLASITEASIHPDDRGALQEVNRRVLEDSTPRPLQYRIVLPDGEVRWVDARGHQVRDGSGTIVALAGFVQDITDRKLEGLADREREVRLQAVIDNAPFGAHMYLLEPDDRLVFIGYNQKAVQMLGIDHEALIGMTLEEAFSGNVGTETPDRYREVARTGTPWEMEQYAYDAEGIAGVFSVYAFSFGPDRVSVFFRDITDQKYSEARVRDSERHFRAAFEQSALGMLETAVDGTFTLTNDRLCEMLGYSREELSLLTFADVTHPDDVEKDLGAAAQMIAGLADDFSTEKRYLRKDGSVLWVFLSAVAVRAEDGHVRYFLCAVEDISARKAAEEALVESNRRLGAMVREVAEAMGRVSEARDPYTQDHEVRVNRLARMVGVEMGMADDDLEALEMACLLHDVGKLHVPVEILTKPGRLSDTEFALIKEHPQGGYDILKGIDFPWPIAEIVLQHHERMDGSGYPRGLTAADILPVTRVLSVADVVEAMATNRPYRPALGLEVAMDELRESASKYDPDVVAACVRLYEAGRIEL
jgi:PAS domain S-box-containing protein/putative nucleotidyltransferase with HDIG domain